MELKQILIVNRSSKITYEEALILMIEGSLKSVEASLIKNKEKVNQWLRSGQKKVTVQVSTTEELEEKCSICDKKNIVSVIIYEKNKIPSVLVIGPDLEKNLDLITGQLKLY